MQIKTTERTMRDLFHKLIAQGDNEAAAGVWLAAGAIWLDRKSWRATTAVTAAAYRIQHTETHA